MDLHQPLNLNNQSGTRQLEPTIALLHCYDLIDDFLDSINISFEIFCKEFIGSWMFGYINALKQVGVRTVLFCVSAHVEYPSHFIHQPTGTKICVLPPSNIYYAYRAVRRKSLNIYGGDEVSSFQKIQDKNRVRRSLLTSVKDVAKSVGTYLATPTGLLSRELKRENCQAILCQEYEYARFDTCVLLGKTMHLPVFATFQGGDKTQSFLEVLPRRLAFHGCAGVIVAAQAEIHRIESKYKISSSKIHQIFNPLDITVWHKLDRQEARKALGIDSKTKIVIWHGRVEIERKGLDVLLKAWQQFCDGRFDQDLKLVLLGTGSDAACLQKLIDEMQLQGITWLKTFISDRSLIQQYLSASDLYVFPSRQEGFPVAPIEAMACGLPVVAAASQGVNDIFETGEASGGLVVPVGDPKSLAVAIGRVLDNTTFAQELGSRAAHRAKTEFSLEIIGQRLRRVLLQQLKEITQT